MEITEVRQVREFLLHGGHDLHAKEIASGTGLSLSSVEAILEIVVAAGEVTKDGTENTAIYNLVGASVMPVVEPTAPWKSTEQIWSDSARKQVLEAEKAKQPPPPKRYSPTEEEIAAATPKPVKPLTAEERQALKLLEGHRGGVNPQAFIR